MKTVNRVGLAVTAMATIVLLAACDSGSGSPSPTPTPSVPSASPAASPSASPTPTATPTPTVSPTPASLGWPRDGWTLRTGVEVGLKSIALYFPNSWTFDTNESGLWWNGTYHVFCDPYVDHTLNNPGAPNVQTLAETQWGLTSGTPNNEFGFTTYFGYSGWGADVTLGDGHTVEPRAYVIVGDVWINCGAITRGTGASGSELWDIVDSILIVDESTMQLRAWNGN